MDRLKEYYERAELWGTGRTSSLEAERAKRLSLLIPSDVMTVLDVGCGDGIVTNLLQAQGFRVVGLDISEEALGYVEAASVCGSAGNLSFAAKSFDLVMATEVLEHLPEPIYRGTLEELERVSRKYILISVPNGEYLPAKYVRCGKCGTIFHVYRHLRSFSADSLRSMFSNFELKRINYCGSQVKTYNRFLLIFRQNLGNQWYWYKNAHPQCPLCGNTEFPRPSRTWVATICNALNKLIPKRGKPQWAIVLSERRRAEDTASC